MTASHPPIKGAVEPDFRPVAEAFAANFAFRDELGAAVCVYHRGRKVVDLWAGTRDRRTGEPWREDTMVPLFSSGKAVAALLAARAVSAGLLDFDAPVSALRPSFVAHGKDAITLREILDHRSGLVLFGQPMDRALLADPEAVDAVIDRMHPVWRPGDAWGYHLATFGPLVATTVRTSDPSGRFLHQVFRDEVGGPLGLAFHFGLPDDVPADRVAHVSLPKLAQVASGLASAPFGLVRQAVNPVSLLHATIREIRDLDVNDRTWLRNEFPSANAVGEVRALARIYAALAAGGEELGLSPTVVADLLQPAEAPPAGARDRVMGVESRFRLGLVRPSRDFPFSRNPRALGMPGLGGSFGFADPDASLAYAYAPNRIGLLPFGEPRERALRTAVHQVVARLEGHPLAAPVSVPVS